MKKVSFFFQICRASVPLIMLACGGQPAQPLPAGDTANAGHRVDVKAFGAEGDGKTDDTQAIQAALDRAAMGDTVYIPKGTYIVRTLRLVANVHVVGDGMLKQPAEIAAQFGAEKQHSDAPLFRAHRISNVYLSFHAETVNESLYASQCSNITVAASRLTGDSTNVRSYAGVLLYDCSACRVTGSTITQYGRQRQSAKVYGYGTAIRILSANGVTISGNKLTYNGENGVFVHDSGDVEIDGNYIHHNGMSGIQVAFNTAERVSNYRITNNRLEQNAADAVDINNRAHGRVVAINTLIAGNYSEGNGFVNGESTPDGSGIATLIGVSDVTLSGNRAFHNNRPAVYTEGCGSITANRNITDGEFELVGSWEKVVLRHNNFPALRLLANAHGTLLDMWYNEVGQLMLPNGIRIDSLKIMENKIDSGPVNINMNGYLKFEGNHLTSKHPAGALLLVNVQGASLLGNHFINAENAAITIGKEAVGVVIDSNDIISAANWLHDKGSPGLRIRRNRVEKQAEGALQ